MIGNAFLQYLLFIMVTLAVSLPLAYVFTRLFATKTSGGGFIFAPVERLIEKIAGPQIREEQDWRQYTFSLLVFNFSGAVLLFLILLYQGHLPWNPQNFEDLPPSLAFNIVISYLADTGWQSYAGEKTLSFFSQMVGLTSQNFLSCATGLCVSFVIARAFVQKESPIIGNFYADLTRSIVYVLLPLMLIFSLLLIWQGVPQTMVPFIHAQTLDGGDQMIAQGPVASQVAAKILGGNGGGFFNANAAHPYENPTPFSNFMQMVAILMVPVALVLSFAQMLKDKKQGWTLLVGMTVFFLCLVALCIYFEKMPHPTFEKLNIDQKITSINPGGNMEGKEVRFGIFNSALWTVATTSTTQGSVNSMIDSYMPLGAIVPLLNMLFGEVVYGGIGYGRYGFLIYGMITVFIASLKIGRMPEYLGKKIEANEIKLAGFVMLIVPICTLCLGAVSLLVPSAAASVTTNGPHGLTQTIYAYASLASKKIVPPSAGTFSTQGPLFVTLLISIIILFGGLVYFPVLALGPIAEHLSLFSN